METIKIEITKKEMASTALTFCRLINEKVMTSQELTLKTKALKTKDDDFYNDVVLMMAKRTNPQSGKRNSLYDGIYHSKIEFKLAKAMNMHHLDICYFDEFVSFDGNKTFFKLESSNIKDDGTIVLLFKKESWTDE